MANLCSFLMKVRGEKEDIEQFHKALNQQGDIWMGRGAETDLTFEDDGSAFMSGWCKWSIISSLVDNAISMRTEPNLWAFSRDDKNLEFITLFEACEKWNLVMEVYSEEPGCEFQEHYICDKGRVICDECVNWEEYDIYIYDTKEEAEEEFGVKFTDEEWNSGEDSVHRGGFGDWIFEI